jgi:hypothetical protein
MEESSMSRILARVGTAVLLAVPSAPQLLADELPQIKVGLWSLESSAGGEDKPRSVLACMNSDMVRELMKAVARTLPANKCTTTVEQKGPNYIEKTDCAVHGRELHVTSTAKFQGDGELHIDSERAETGSNLHTDGKYLSSCPTGMQAGDIVAGNGAKFNVLREAQAAAPAAASSTSPQ